MNNTMTIATADGRTVATTIEGLERAVDVMKRVATSAGPDETQQEALVAHELCHIEKDVDNRGRSRYWLANHDLEEFSWIVRRYGIWDDSLRKFFTAFENGETERKQLSLFEGGAAS